MILEGEEGRSHLRRGERQLEEACVRLLHFHLRAPRSARVAMDAQKKHFVRDVLQNPPQCIRGVILHWSILGTRVLYPEDTQIR